MNGILEQIFFLILPALAIGVLNCLWGFKIFTNNRKFVGFVTGACIAVLVATGIYYLSTLFQLPAWVTGLRGLIIFLIMFFLSLLGMYISLRAEKTFTAFSTFISGVLIGILAICLAYLMRFSTTSISTDNFSSNAILFLMAGAIVGLIFAVSSLFAPRGTVILASSILGSGVLAFTLVAIAGLIFPAFFQSQPGFYSLIILVLWIVFSILSIWFQTSREKKSPAVFHSLNSKDAFTAFKKTDSGWYLLIGVVLVIILLVVFTPNPYAQMINFMTDGILRTIFTTVVAFSIVLFLGLFGGLGRVSSNKILRGIATVYVEIIRGIPLLVQIFFWYFAVPAIIREFGRSANIYSMANFKANDILMAILGMTVCYGAYMSEVYRAGIQSIPKGQMEAARSLGMSYSQAMTHIILPQAFRVILPPVGNEFITLLKDSSLISVVGIADLTRRGQEFATKHFIPIQTYLMLALVYLVMTLLASRLVTHTEQSARREH
jgi:polar amino acid transport system permease protein